MSFVDIKKKILWHEKERQRNLNIHCKLVAEKHQREINRLKKKLEEQKENEEQS